MTTAVAPDPSTTAATTAVVYGPFHRIRTPTQSNEDAKKQVLSQQLWGRPRQHSNIPQVQAYDGPLPKGDKGIEFTTLVPPDQGTTPRQARWTGPRDGVIVEDGFAKIQCHSLRVIVPTPYVALPDDNDDEVAPTADDWTVVAPVDPPVSTASDAGDDRDDPSPEDLADFLLVGSPVLQNAL